MADSYKDLAAFIKEQHPELANESDVDVATFAVETYPNDFKREMFTWDEPKELNVLQRAYGGLKRAGAKIEEASRQPVADEPSKEISEMMAPSMPQETPEVPAMTMMKGQKRFGPDGKEIVPAKAPEEEYGMLDYLSDAAKAYIGKPAAEAAIGVAELLPESETKQKAVNWLTDKYMEMYEDVEEAKPAAEELLTDFENHPATQVAQLAALVYMSGGGEALKRAPESIRKVGAQIFYKNNKAVISPEQVKRVAQAVRGINVKLSPQEKKMAEAFKKMKQSELANVIRGRKTLVRQKVEPRFDLSRVGKFFSRFKAGARPAPEQAAAAPSTATAQPPAPGVTPPPARGPVTQTTAGALPTSRGMVAGEGFTVAEEAAPPETITRMVFDPRQGTEVPVEIPVQYATPQELEEVGVRALPSPRGMVMGEGFTVAEQAPPRQGYSPEAGEEVSVPRGEAQPRPTGPMEPAPQPVAEQVVEPPVSEPVAPQEPEAPLYPGEPEPPIQPAPAQPAAPQPPPVQPAAPKPKPEKKVPIPEGEKEAAKELELEPDYTQAGSVVVPTPGMLKKAAAKAAGLVSTEAPASILGGKETGRQIKILNSKRASAAEKGVKQVIDANKIVPDAESASDAYFLAANSSYAGQIPDEQKAKLQPVVDQWNKLRETYAQELKDRGIIEQEWPQSAINRLQKDQDDLQAEMLSTKENKNLTAAAKKEQLADLQKQADKNANDIERLQSLKYVHLPTRMMLGQQMEQDPAKYNKVLSASFRNILGRKTVDPYDLVEEGILQKEDFDIRKAMATYVNYVERQKAVADIRDAAVQEGLVKKVSRVPKGPDAPPTETEGWVDIGDKYPIFKGYRVHPGFADNLVNNFEQMGNKWGPIANIMSHAKMLQFYNPIIMPMYDIIQSVGVTQGGAFLPWNIHKSIKDVMGKTDNYFEALDNGLASQPAPTPFKSFEADMNRALQGTGAKDAIKAEAKRLKENPIRILSDTYRASWGLAWSLDKTLRMMSYNHLRSRGFSPKMAAKLAAEAHADYADVPVKTRKALNMALFTPTFQISMGKWFAKMMMSSLRMPYTTAKAKRTGEGTEEAKADRHRAMSLATVIGLLGAMDYVLTKKMGWKREEFARRYTKPVEDKDGTEKQAVMTLSNPINVPQKYYYTFLKAKPGYTKAEQWSKYGRYWLHPVWKLAADLKDNRKPDGNPIANPFTPPSKQAIDMARYTAAHTFAMYSDLIEKTKDTKAEAFQALKKHGHWMDQLLRPVTFAYLRQNESRQVQRKINSLNMTFGRVLRDEHVTMKELKQSYKEYMRQLDVLEKNTEKMIAKRDIIEARKKKYKEWGKVNTIYKAAGDKWGDPQYESLQRAKGRKPED